MKNSLRNRPFCSFHSSGMFWFRFFGYGLHFKNTNTHSLLFSERYGYSKKLKIGDWLIGFLN